MYHGERFNSITHLVGAIAAAVGFSWLVWSAVQQDDLLKIVSFSLYGITLLLLYLASTLYHSVRGRIKPLLQKLERIGRINAIFALNQEYLTLNRTPQNWDLSHRQCVWMSTYGDFPLKNCWK